jgi:hypothetical protein
MDDNNPTQPGQAVPVSWKRFTSVVYSGVILLICILLRVSDTVQLALVSGFTLTVLTFIGADTTQKVKELLAGINQKADN